jgi:hypothetical protein
LAGSAATRKVQCAHRNSSSSSSKLVSSGSIRSDGASVVAYHVGNLIRGSRVLLLLLLLPH